VTKAMYMCGSKVSLADATVFPTIVFAAYMLPKFGVNPPLPPKIATWFENLKTHDVDFKRVYDEIMGGLATWESNHRWDHLLGAGWRDLEPATLFDKIIAGEIPVEVVEQPDDKVLCFKDNNPVAPAHVLIIPKDRDGLTRLAKATAEHTDILGRLMVRQVRCSRGTVGFRSSLRVNRAICSYPSYVSMPNPGGGCDNFEEPNSRLW
jgi:Scavenger mRNA decapping enzyme C-term binding/Glutathione S-transferase, C-terminal domain